MENWLSAQNMLAVVGLVLVVAGLVSFKVGKWVLEKTESETDKFIRFLWQVARLILLVVGFGGIIFGAWLVWPAVSSFFIGLINGIYL